MASPEETPAQAGWAGVALRRALTSVLLGGTAIVVLYDWLGVGGESFDFAISGLVYDAVIFAAGLACLVRAHDAGRERGAWLLIGAAVLSWSAAEIYWTAFLENNASAPYPSPADIGYLAFYPLAYAGLALLVRAKAEELDWRLWMDGLIAALGTGALGAAFIFDFVADHATGTGPQVATTLAYPIGDIGMLSLTVGAVALTRWRPGRTLSLLLAGLSALVVADIAYTLQWTSESLPSGDWIDPLYAIAALCLGAEMWQPTTRPIARSARFDGWRELMVPFFFAAVMIGLFAMQYLSAQSGLSTVLWAATMIAVIARLAMSVRENKQLLEQVRTDPLTGLGNQGRMQVDLASRCERAAAQPVTLMLFDLNNFKRYNDTYGHPAGDVLLADLGRALSEAVGEEGVAYRVGGDEFAVLFTGRPERLDAMVKRTAEALTARAPTFDVTASWGKAGIPAEASEPAAAMQLADVRMYAQKESRRLSPRHDDGLDLSELTAQAQQSPAAG
ncbi:MAG TPA: diguanylate cyclase [Solirubrobacterales bacterium]|nr:diguanylate cyclase [Solirubrobacterales bacterium]